MVKNDKKFGKKSGVFGEFLEWFGVFLERFGVFLERFGVGENIGISMSRFVHCIHRQILSVYYVAFFLDI